MRIPHTKLFALLLLVSLQVLRARKFVITYDNNVVVFVVMFCVQGDIYAKLLHSG